MAAGCVHPREAGGGKTRVPLMEGLPGRLTVLLDHSHGLPPSPFRFQRQIRGLKMNANVFCESKTCLWNSFEQNLILILWLEYVSFPIGSLRAFGSLKHLIPRVEEDSWSWLIQLPCSVRVTLLLATLQILFAGSKRTFKVSLQGAPRVSKDPQILNKAGRRPLRGSVSKVDPVQLGPLWNEGPCIGK